MRIAALLLVLSILAAAATARARDGGQAEGVRPVAAKRRTAVAPRYGGPAEPARLSGVGARAAEAVRQTWPAAELRIDGRLSDAAGLLARRLAAGEMPAEVTRPESVRLALARSGAVAPEVWPLAIRASEAEPALRRLGERLAAEQGTPPPGIVGIGHAEVAGVHGLVLLRAPLRAILDPFPAEVEPGSRHRLSGRLLPPRRGASVHLTSPSGRTRTLAAEGGGRSFAATIPFPERGRWTVEVMAQGARGPEVVALLEVQAGGRLPERPEPRGAYAEPEPASVEGKEALAARLVDRLREEKGLEPLPVDPLLSRVARSYAEELLRTGQFAHHSPTSGDLGARLRRAGHRFERAGENLAQAPTVRMAHESTVRSPGHLANLLGPGWRRAGYGVAVGTLPGGAPTVVLVQIFSTP